MGEGQKGLLFDLETLAGQDTPVQNADRLHRIVNLFINGALHFPDEQVAVFDDVISYLVDRIETKLGLSLPSASRRSQMRRPWPFADWLLTMRSTSQRPF